MNIELDEVVVQDVSDDALEQAAGGAQGGSHAPALVHTVHTPFTCWKALHGYRAVQDGIGTGCRLAENSELLAAADPDR